MNIRMIDQGSSEINIIVGVETADFETAVRAILGQQVSVARATVLANALVERYGAGQFPTPAALAAATPAELGMPGLRGQAISSLAQQVAQGSLHLDGQPQELRAELLQIPGIGPWTAEYVAMRVARDADAFVATDWVVRKQLGLTPAADAGLSTTTPSTCMPFSTGSKATPK